MIDPVIGHLNKELPLSDGQYRRDVAESLKLADPKETNPKTSVGTAKVPFSTVPAQVVAELGLAMLEGGLKYGRHNYRVAGVRASVYVDAAMRHILAWWEGQDIDPDSGLSHVTKAIASLSVLRDAQINGVCTDDRPPSPPLGWIEALNVKAKALLEKYPNPKEAYTIEATKRK